MTKYEVAVFNESARDRIKYLVEPMSMFAQSPPSSNIVSKSTNWTGGFKNFAPDQTR